ncbi:hypothetical protein FA09DRAFT_331013 [Tilletiopsis washingtonensis]|uniref:Uncharacterized protein n=1 Tax=Tilletiopsis washingtonensis TaxID=58919 RepID=A0A316Z5X2_9BASI|nr:hypothetical protein FA09DRAFT_331013 [Tilletiopsis washingtonensis]PWN96961.1 hypothetical protein FA09DRAFT_331013 [Tilletiopsis washingtonensis]
MAFIANKVARGFIERNAKQYEPVDPFYEYYVDASGKEKRRKRPPPPGLTKEEAKLLRKISRRAHYLDKGFHICGFKFGWTFIIGIIPGAGDIASAGLNYTLVLKPAKKGVDLPDWVVHRMVVNNAVSAGIGFVPLVGDIALAIWRANSRNAKLLEEFLRVKGEEHILAGLPGLTTEQPLPPGARSKDGGTAPEQHPAQASAKEFVKSNSSNNLQPGGAQAAARK